MQKEERVKKILSIFNKLLPDPETELEYIDPFQLLISVILSAQCTDKRVNSVTPALFKRFPDPASLASTTFPEVLSYIKSISYPNNKTRHIIGMAQMLVDKFKSRVPTTLEDLMQLPGVGRKTANVIASVLYHQPVLAVDTHVFRVSKRIGLVSTQAKTPLAVEKELTELIPRKLIHKAHHWLLLHGRYICVARSPRCIKCPVADYCQYYEANLIKHL